MFEFFEESKPITDRERLERAFLAQATELIVNSGTWIDWDRYFEMFGFNFDEIEQHVGNRLMRSQYWGDHDYPMRVYDALKFAYKKDPQMAIGLVVYILQEVIKPDEEKLEKYPAVKAFLGNKGITDFSQLLPKVGLSLINYLDISDFPDPFYRDLIELINKCYSYGIYPAVLVFSRKLLENLLIDILRRKYGMENIDLFFDRHHCRFRNFNELLRNFKIKVKEDKEYFKAIVPDIEDIIGKIDEFREKANATAHRLEDSIHIQKEWLDRNRENLNYIVKVLIRIYNNLA
jgi:hypothetical protein